MSQLADCVVVTSFEAIDPTLVIPAITIAPAILTNSGYEVPALTASWSTITNPYVTGIQFEYGPSDLSQGITTSESNKDALSWVRTDGLVSGKSYAVRYRPKGENVFGLWVGPVTVVLGTVEIAPADPPPTVSGIPTIAISSTIAPDGTETTALSGNWAAATDAVQYDVEFDNGAVTWTETFPGNAFKTYRVVAGLSYRFRVKGVNRDGVASLAWSSWSTNTPASGDTTAPGALTPVSITSGARRVTLTWTNPADDDYSHAILYRNTSGTSPATTLEAPYKARVSGDSFADAVVTAGTVYFYWTKPVDRSGNIGALTVMGAATPTFVSTGGGDISPTDPIVVTSLGTAALLLNQTEWATSPIPTSHLTRPGSNLLFNGGMKLGGQGYIGGFPTYDPVGGNYLVYTANAQITPKQPATAGQSYVLSAESTFFNSTNHFVYLVFWSAANAYLGEGSRAGYGQSFARDAGPPIVAPAGTATMQVYSFVSGIGVGGYIAVRKLKIEAGTVATPFNDDATDGARYRTGQAIDQLQPGEAGANVTETRTAALLSGQGPLATMPLPSYANQAAALAAGLTDGRTFLNTTANRLDTVVVGAAGSATALRSSISNTANQASSGTTWVTWGTATYADLPTGGTLVPFISATPESGMTITGGIGSVFNGEWRITQGGTTIRSGTFTATDGGGDPNLEFQVSSSPVTPAATGATSLVLQIRRASGGQDITGGGAAVQFYADWFKTG